MSVNITRTNGDYLTSVKAAHGQDKVKKASLRYNLFHESEQGKPLNPDHVRQLQIGLNDICSDDLDSFMRRLKSGASLSGRENKVSPHIKEQLAKYSTSSELPADLFNDLLKALREPQIEFAPRISLAKITGMPITHYFQHGWFSFQSGRNLEDEERLRIYEEIETLDSGDQARYCELLSKILVKKHLYYEKGISLTLGMLIPGLKGPDGKPRWYRVEEMMDSGWGKFAYRLTPATTQYGADMADILLYRSSGTLPTAMDSFTSYLNDINIFPPGYFSRNRCKEQELKWLTESTPTPKNRAMRPLLITGHSLGASNSQLALISLQKSELWPNREISLELFDSPAICSQDAKAFAAWYDKNPSQHPLTLNYYVSQGDPVPLAGYLFGSTYLGNYTKNIQARVYKMSLTPQSPPEVAGLIGPHGRVFFRGKKGMDYQVTSLSIEQFDKENWAARVATNLARIGGALVVWPTLGSAGLIKRFFWGRRHHDPIISQIFRTLISHLPF